MYTPQENSFNKSMEDALKSFRKAINNVKDNDLINRNYKRLALLKQLEEMKKL